jgi:hypothetical protein
MEVPVETMDVVPHGPRLPDELVERILLEAWRSASPPVTSRPTDHFNMGVSRYRWFLYASLARTSRLFRRILLDLPFLHAVFRTPGDAQLYQYIIPRTLSELKSGITVRKAEKEHGELFSRTHVLMDWVGDKSSFRDPFSLPPGPYTTLSGADRPIVPNAITVVSWRWGSGPELQDWLCTLPSLKTIRILRSDIPPVQHRPDHQREIGMPVYKVQRWGLGNRSLRAMAELDGPAEHFDVLHRMGSTGPLTMLTKQSLRSAARFFPGMVTLLVLDTPPGPDGVSDITEWNIPGGLGAGVLVSGIRRRSEQPTIVVKGAKDVEPSSWQLAGDACEAKGVTLKLEIAY